jgi:hypothetical protein
MSVASDLAESCWYSHDRKSKLAHASTVNIGVHRASLSGFNVLHPHAAAPEQRRTIGG